VATFIPRCAAVLLGVFSSSTAWAKSDQQLWITTSANAKLGNQWRLSEEVVVRFSDQRHGLYEVESNTLVGRILGKGVTFWAGYTHDPQYSRGHSTTMEHRAREQVTIDNLARLGPGKLSARMRLEQRWRRGVDGTGWRARPYFKYSVPLNAKATLNFSNETFVNFSRTDFQRQRGIDRMRSLMSISGPLLKRLSGEAGYMNQHGFVRAGPDTDDHVAYFALSLSV
jgi:hypothetical protein